MWPGCATPRVSAWRSTSPGTARSRSGTSRTTPSTNGSTPPTSSAGCWGWDFIPLTVIREGPHGIGSLQYYVDHDPKVSYYDLRETDSDTLRTMACFDLVSNNADRKAVHFLRDTAGKVWGIDHGLTFSSAMKVRTVIWDFGGEAIPEHLLEALSEFLRRLVRPDDAVTELLELLDDEEVAGLIHRMTWLLDVREYPAIRRRRHRR